jgi:Serine aminopeptidase, S33
MSSSHALPRERVAPLGQTPAAEPRPLVAIVSEPQSPRPLPAVLLVNAGVIHRVGPHRLHVRLARRLAEAGHLALRMDLSGIGDSGPVPERLDFRTSAVADIRSAADHLTAGEAADSVIVFGVCSGADNALAAAAVEPRIRGLVLVDPPAYATPQARRRALGARVRDPQAWTALPGRVLGRLRRGVESDALDEADTGAAQGGRRPPPQAEYGRQLRALADRGVRVLAVYTAAQGVRYNHANQLFEAFPDLRGRIDVRYFADANHTFTELSQQAALIDAVVAWCAARPMSPG